MTPKKLKFYFTDEYCTLNNLTWTQTFVQNLLNL